MVERETIVVNETSFLVAGSLASKLELGAPCLACNIEFPGYNQPGEETGNSVKGLALNAVIIMGGVVTDLGTLRDCVVKKIKLIGNHDEQGGVSWIFQHDETVLNAAPESVSHNPVQEIEITDGDEEPNLVESNGDGNRSRLTFIRSKS